MIVTDVGPMVAATVTCLRHEHSKSLGFFQNYYELTNGLDFFSHLFPPFTHNYQQQQFIHIHESTNKYICTIINLEKTDV